MPQNLIEMVINKSEVLDIDNPDLSNYPKFAKATPFGCFREPGDVLFIPALWFHNVISCQVGEWRETWRSQPLESTAQQLSFEWSHFRFPSTDPEVRTTSIINITTGKYCSIAFI